MKFWEYVHNRVEVSNCGGHVTTESSQQILALRVLFRDAHRATEKCVRTSDQLSQSSDVTRYMCERCATCFPSSGVAETPGEREYSIGRPVRSIACRVNGLHNKTHQKQRMKLKGCPGPWIYHTKISPFTPYCLPKWITATYFVTKLESKQSKLRWLMVAGRGGEEPKTI